MHGEFKENKKQLRGDKLNLHASSLSMKYIILNDDTTYQRNKADISSDHLEYVLEEPISLNEPVRDAGIQFVNRR